MKTGRWRSVYIRWVESVSGAGRGMCHRWGVQPKMPCVGIVVIAGYLSFVVAPDPIPSVEQRLAQSLHSLPTIVLDPGHGGRDEGARAHGLVEKELALDVAQRSERLLQSFGYGSPKYSSKPFLSGLNSG